MTEPKFWRSFSMPSMHTFTMKPVRALLDRLVVNPYEWVDPFCGLHSPARYTNDMNPSIPATSHVDAGEFIESLAIVRNCLFDPPYSPRQISEMYKSIGLKVGMKETQSAAMYARVRDAIAKKMPAGGMTISFGWNTTGFGISRGYEKIEIGLVNHGGAHNDTLIVVERKVR